MLLIEHGLRAEVIVCLLVSKFFRLELRCMELLPLILSLQLLSLLFDLDNVLTELGIVEWATEPLHDQFSRTVIAGDLGHFIIKGCLP
jgi:hypothetical protein